jgi:hypothetical protein
MKINGASTYGPLWVLCWISSIFLEADAFCPNRCSSHGTCDASGLCACYEGWKGGAADCSKSTIQLFMFNLFTNILIGTCPTGPAWADRPYASGLAHQPIECSGSGTCDRSTGLCSCLSGFGGIACERKLCPNSCNHHGSCLTLSDAAMFYGLDYNSSLARSGDGLGVAYQNWDSSYVMICVCDYGYFGPDCGLSMSFFFLVFSSYNFVSFYRNVSKRR